MKIERLHVHALGGLRDLDTGPEPLPNLVVLHGSNEAGKTTIMEAIRTLLYGFYPARRDTHPLTPWEGDRPAELEGWVRESTGERYRITRRLMSQPMATLCLLDDEGRGGDGAIRDIKNEDLPGARSVPRTVFGQTHTLTLPELAAFGASDPWQAIRDRILAGLGTEDLQSPRLVAAALGEEALKLWRPDRRGSAVYRALEGALSEARAALRVARQDEEARRSDQRALADKKTEIEEARQRRDALRERQQAARRILPLLGQARQLETLRRQVGNSAALQGLPLDLREAVLRTQEAAEAASDAHAQGLAAIARMHQAQPEVGDWDASLLDARLDLDALRQWVVAMEEENRQRAREAEEVQALADEVRSLAAPLLAPSQTDPETTDPLALARAQAAALSQLPHERVQSATAEHMQAERDLALSESALAEAQSRPEPAPPRMSPASTFRLLWGMGGLVILVALLRLLTGSEVGLGIPAMALLGGIALVITAVWLQRDQARAENAHARELDVWKAAEQSAQLQVDRARDQRARAQATLDALLAPLNLQATHRTHPSSTLVTALRELDRQLRTLARAEARADTPAAANKAFQETLAQIYQRLGDAGCQALGLPSLDSAPPRPTLDHLSRLLGEAEQRRADLGTWERDLAEENRRLVDLEGRLAKATGEREALMARIHEAQPDLDGEQKIAVLQERILAHEKAQALTREWIMAHGSEAAVLAEIEPWREDPSCTPEGLEATDRRLHDMDDDLAERLSDIRALEERLSQVPSTSPDLILGEIGGIEEAMLETAHARDRLRVLQAVVTRGEETFRQREQPALLRRAESLLRTLTQDRYQGILLQTEDDADLAVRGHHLPGALPIDAPLSTGTREQIWFALRIAALESVEGTGAPLPLILDEVMVNWDQARRAQALDAMVALSESRQIFLLTCHPSLAEEAVQVGAREIVLPSPAAGGA